MRSAQLSFIGVVLALGGVMACAAAVPEQSETVFTREQVTAIIADTRKIVTPQGVQELIAIPIGGVKQWISVRGRDRNNPILLYIHGGPASTDMPVSWTFQDPWEDYFTVVQWDQRGAGKSYTANDPKLVAGTLSVERFISDADEVVQYLRKTYAQDKIFVAGHSWGSAIGLGLARRRPEWLHAYVGIGQVISARRNEELGYEFTLRAAQAARNADALEELRSIAPYPEVDGSLPLQKIALQRKWSVFFGGLTYGRSDFSYFDNAASLAPEYTQADVAAIDKGSELSLPPLLAEMKDIDYSTATQFRCPILLFAGRHDYTTPSSVAAEWIERVQAPSKRLIWFESSAHMIPLEEPGRVLVHLVNDVRPLADIHRTKP